MKLIALTGGIGTGKSTVSQMLRGLGATVIDADQAARAVVEPGTDGLRLIAEQFGDDAITSEGALDRQRIAAIVFADPERRQALNAIVHPRVQAWMAERTREALERGDPLVVHDIPLLFENDRQGPFERSVLVYAPAGVALRRLVARGMSEADARARMAAQMPIEEKRALATDVIDNSDGLDRTREQVERLWRSLSK